MWSIISVVLIILGLGTMVTYFIVDGYDAWQQWKAKGVAREAVRVEQRRAKDLAAMAAEAQRQANARVHEERYAQEIKEAAEKRAKAAEARKPVTMWWLGVAREDSLGRRMPSLYYMLDDFNPANTDTIMLAYEHAENAKKDVVVLPHIGITVRTKTAVRIRIREASVVSGEMPTFIV